MNEALNPTRNVYVSASAGTGKTWLLAARVTRLLLAGARADGILALTFTRKAAAEMRERVLARLREMAFAGEAELRRHFKQLDLEPSPELLARARGLYEELIFAPLTLRAMTLHAFAQDLVSRFALQCGIAPGADAVEDEQELHDGAWQGLQDELHAQRDAPPAQALRTLIAQGYGERALRSLVSGFLYRRNDWRAYVAGQAEPLEYLATELTRILEVRTGDDAYAGVDGRCDNLIRTMHRVLLRTEGVGSLKAERIAPALNTLGEARLDALSHALLTQKGEPRAYKASQRLLKLGAPVVEDFERAREKLLDCVMRARDLRLKLATRERTLAGCTLGAAALRHFEEELRRRAALPFAEIEWHASHLLHDPATASWAAYKIDQRVEHLLLDEFQDTSNTQWQLLRPALEEIAAGGERARSVFIVGDIKQSIYGFRRANPELMPLAQQFLREQLHGHDEELSSSRRSTPAVIEAVNAVFAQAPAREMLPDFPEHQTFQEGWGRVEVAPLVAPEVEEETGASPFRNPLENDLRDAENTRALIEGELIARRIRALVEAHAEIEGHGVKRALGYGDIIILLQRRTHQQALERALIAAGIPYAGAARGTLLQTVEAQDLTALLRFLDSPWRNLDLAHALRSPVFGASDEDLIALAMLARERECSWSEALLLTPSPSSQEGGEGWGEGGSHQAPLTPALSPLFVGRGRPEVLQRARSLLGAWLEAARRLPVHDLLDRICSEGNVAARYEAALPQVSAARVRANLNVYIQLALEIDSGRYPSLARFLRRLQRLARDETLDEAPPPAEGGQVRIMTIHAAKGLEAPAVFLAQTACAKTPRGADWLVQWPHGEERPTEFLLAGNAATRDGHTRRLLDERAAREAREEMNLLYVALTRARQFLHVSAFATKKKSAALSWHDLACAALTGMGAAADDEGVLVHARGEPAQMPATSAPTAARATDPRLRQRITQPAPPRAAPAQLAHDADPAHARRGDAIHLLLQLLTDGVDDERKLRTRLRARLDYSGKEFTEWLTEARAVIAAPALAQFYDSARYRRAWNEVPLLDGDTAGVIDRLVDDGVTLWVLDYKTQRDANGAALLELYAQQLRAYRAGAARLWPGREVRAGLVLTQHARWVDLPP